MRLRNKTTGEIGYTAVLQSKAIMIMDENAIKLAEYTSLAKLNEEWEDYEEPKEYWFIDCDGAISCCEYGIVSGEKGMISIGNHFETREEAVKALGKLEAWKRLKDKGISFEVKVIDRKWYLEPKAEPLQRTFDEAHDLFKDIMFIFGGEE